ncbi:MAG: ankyrin repeat domain-containing protein [Gammaproteobacteria bacterium]|nr:ankyrin repeat domain-containing protein [Gammaproteobacteria bacterium]
MLLKDLINNLISAESGAFDFDFKGGTPPAVLVKINPAKLTDDDIPIIKSLFTYFLQDQRTFELKLRLATPNVLKLRHLQPYEIDQFNFNKECVSLDHYQMKLFFMMYHPLVNSTLSIGILSALFEKGVSVEIDKWCENLKSEMLIFHLEKGEKTKFVFDHFVEIFKYLSNLTNDQKVIDDTFNALLTTLIVSHSLKSFPEIKDEPFLSAFRKSDSTYYFLHLAMKSKYVEGFELILKLMGGTPLHDYDQNGNSFLHVCNDEQYYEQALKLSPNINHFNNKGNTALHEAADTGNLKKSQFLLKHGANPDLKNYKGETFWTLDPQQKYDSLHHFRLYKQHGQVLKSPPDIAQQKGITCGFYAVACAANYNRQWHPQLFKQPVIYARKLDVNHPKPSSSLRQMRKSLGISGQGAVFSAKELAKVIEKAECKSLICEINDYIQFMQVIKKAIEQNLPVIIPFASQSGLGQAGKPESQSPKGEGAHWATIIGLGATPETEGILLAQYGEYFDTKATELFKSFYEIEVKFPESYLSKKKGEDWELSATPMPLTEGVKIDIIPLTDLSDFRRKLIVVLPPNYDLELFNFNQEELLRVNQNK